MPGESENYCITNDFLYQTAQEGTAKAVPSCAVKNASQVCRLQFTGRKPFRLLEQF